MPDREFSVAMREDVDRALQAQLMRTDGDEDLCFALYQKSTGCIQDGAIIVAPILPLDGDRRVHGNASFASSYFERAVGIARQRGLGLAFLHAHPLGSGWQQLSAIDFEAELRMASATLGATGSPLIGMTRARDAWSARCWRRSSFKSYLPVEARNVRIVGRALAVSSPLGSFNAMSDLEAMSSVWGSRGEGMLARLRVGIAGLGSVGSAVNEILARMGIEQVVLVDFDVTKRRNLARQSNAERTDVALDKVAVAARAFLAHSTAPSPRVFALPVGCDEPIGYAALLDCDVVFACVDRPWPRRILNELSYSALIPVVDGGIRVRKRRGRFVGAHWHVHTVGPDRRCLQCWKAFDPSDAALDHEGLLDDPTYVRQLGADHPLLSRDNIFPFAVHVAAMEAMQFANMVVGAQPDLGDQNYHFSTGTIDHSQDPGCLSGCPYAALVGAGDRSVPPLADRPGRRAFATQPEKKEA